MARSLAVAAAAWLALGLPATALVSDAVARHATSIRARHYAAPTTPASASARRLARVRLADLTGSSARADEARATLREALRADTVALVELPEDGSAVAELGALWATASRFFDLDDEARSAYGPPKEPPTSALHRGQSRAAGYTASSVGRFLDTRLRSGGSSGGVEVLPPSLDARVLGFEAALAGAQGVLLDVGAAALASVLAELPMHARASAAEAAGTSSAAESATAADAAELARALLDETASLEEGVTGASVLRLASYGGAGGGGGDGEDRKSVV